MKQAIINLLKIKSLMTIIVMVVFAILALTNRLDPALIASVISAVITFYFAKNKKEDE